ncbi:uncharacterized protein LOC135814776 [Sycon ciliatum]|uniref:uncharacterized protein LOC135814776 n=1 Tax=Sycon ciliatum TaxID=27933 RepID=UPI0031F6540E
MSYSLITSTGSSAVCILLLLLPAISSSSLLANARSATVELTLLTEAAGSKGAVCLDGTPPGYYWRQGQGTALKKWIIHQEGGGWCFSDEDCLTRSRTRLGSSKYFAPNKTFLHAGFLADDCQTNPVFCDYNVVYMPYCDGGSFSGNREKPLVVNGTSLYMRGKRILDAVFDTFSEQLGEAEELILTGCSAGGLATYLHADYPVETKRIPSTCKYAVLADAGYFIDGLSQNGQRAERTRMLYVVQSQNLTSGMNQKCVAAMSEADQWKCFFAQYSVPYISSPIFALQSLYDYNQLKTVLHLPCIPPKCSASEYQIFLNWRTTFLKAFSPILNRTVSTGIFSDACVAHCQSVADAHWDNYVVRGQRAHETFAAWYFDQPGKLPQVVDCAYPCNHNCTARHTLQQDEELSDHYSYNYMYDVEPGLDDDNKP